jgi:hypothetical protein
MIEALTVDAVSTIHLLESIEALYPMLVLHVFLDNARYHRAKLVREWLARPGRRIKLQWAVILIRRRNHTTARHVCLIDWNADLI